MKHFKHLLLTLLTLTLIIRPVFAEGLMLYTDSGNTVATVQMMELMNHTEHSQMKMLHDQNHALDTAMNHSAGHPMNCANAGLHQCDGNCMDNSCSFISAVSAITTAENLQLFSAEQSQIQPLSQPALLARPIPPEQRPPLV